MLRPTIRALVFLDFDGVLHPCTAGTFTRLPSFESFLREQPDVGVVLTTTWRLDSSLADLRDYFAPDLRDRILDLTDALPDTTRAQRFQEIVRWRQAHHVQALPWAALDDTADLFPPYCPELVLCDTIKGLRPAQFAQLHQVLGLPDTAVATPVL